MLLVAACYLLLLGTPCCRLPAAATCGFLPSRRCMLVHFCGSCMVLCVRPRSCGHCHFWDRGRGGWILLVLAGSLWAQGMQKQSPNLSNRIHTTPMTSNAANLGDMGCVFLGDPKMAGIQQTGTNSTRDPHAVIGVPLLKTI